MDPWASVGRGSRRHLQVEDVVSFVVREHRVRVEQRAREAEGRPSKRHSIKERNYETYNYLENRTGSEDDDDLLSSILVRARERKEKRKQVEEIAKLRQLEETKRKIEEEKRRCLMERRKQEDKLRELKETHRLRVLKEQQWRAREARELSNKRKADEFRRKLLLRQYFTGFIRLVEISKNNKKEAMEHYTKVLLQKSLKKLLTNKQSEQRRKEKMASDFHAVRLLRRSLEEWSKKTSARRAQLQSAESHYQRVIQRRYLWLWKWAALDALLQRRTSLQLATQHHRRKLLADSVRRWRAYVTGRRLRHGKDTVSSRLRFLVKDIIPDFSPVSSDADDASEDEGGEDGRWDEMIAVLTI
ncbi:coiled-coil domain-containing protein 191-like [Penaeus vannamei]|uniref:coiled-coil domain-containing protein 191-like n=1 Tax=Penaeus vannamei TaxID=6689 RepID=UPI00387F8AC0